MALLACSLLGFGLSACGSVRYLAHLGAGQLGVLLDRELLDDARLAQLTEPERRNVALARRALAYGASLGLAETTSYRHLLDREAGRALRVVIAAPADRLEPLTWWFPITGRVAYRGYFDAERAERFVEKLSAEGYDTYLRTAAAYSTLGFFDDPIPRPMLRWPAHALVDTLLHELVHESVFVSGDTRYNESLATFIAQHATLAFFADAPVTTESARRDYRDDASFATLLEELRTELETVYAQAEDAERARALREPLFERYQGPVFHARDWETTRYTGFPETPLSNAYLIAQRTYLGDLPCLERELEALGGSLPALIARHRNTPGRGESCALPAADEGSVE